MASTLNASNAGSGGLISTADASGVLQLQSAGTTAVTIDSSQNVGIGTTSPTSFGAGYQVLDVYGSGTGGYVLTRSPTVTGQMSADGTGLNLQTRTNHPIMFNVNNSEKMRIDSSGNVGIGGTYSGARLFSKSSTSDNSTYPLILQNSSSSFLFFVRSDGYTNTGTAAQSPYNQTVGSAANTYIHSDGSLQRSTSSLKYKKNIQDATHGLKEVLQIRPITYESKNELENGKVFGGLIAEEIHDLGLTEFVQYAQDGTPDALAYGNMVSLLTKAIQEQQTIINNLTARITALEAK